MGVERCSERYKVKGVMGCVNRHVEEEMLVKAYLMAWNAGYSLLLQLTYHLG